MNQGVSTFRLLTTFIVVLAICGPAASVSGQPVELHNWQYRWGDSPADNGRFLWANEPADTGWASTGSRLKPVIPGDDHFVWYRVRLPHAAPESASLLLPAIGLAFEVYVDDEMIHIFGDLRPSHDNKYAAVTTHIIPLPAGYAGKWLYVRSFSDISQAVGQGFEALGPMIGTGPDLIRLLARRGAEQIGLGLLLIFIGLVSLLVFLRRAREGALFPLSFGAFAVLIGSFYLFSESTTWIFIESPQVKVYLRFLSFLLFPVPMYFFLERITHSRRVVRSLWISHSVYAVVAVVLDLTNSVVLPMNVFFYNYLFIVTILVAIVVSWQAARRGSREARIFLWGFAVLGLTGLHDLMVGLEILPFWRWLSHWGALVFVLSQGYILEQRIASEHRRLQIYSRELEEKSVELEEYSQKLEERVKERTRDLDLKNRELWDTLDELQQTQEQLVLREKMASLGNLVAGVAHEVNNPIGAVSSAADTSARCIDVIRKHLPPAEEGGSRLDKAMALLTENNGVIATASQRITQIVKSLKNFSRLDEAERKQADIHEGINSTLTLAHHFLKGRVEVIKEYGDIPPVDCYPNELNQVFMNLFSNAADAIDGQGTLRIRTWREDDKVYVSVKDSGRGIPQSDLGQIFDPGFTTKGVGVGTGLGLSISYNIIDKHNGSMRVDSVVGEGTTFTISLPL